jgi:hypothetical protein
MKKSVVISLAVGAIIAAATFGYVYYEKRNNQTVETSTINESAKTKVYSVLNIPMEKRNMIWCGTFQMAWNELRDNIIKEDIKLKDENALSPELNKKTFTKDYIDEKDYIAMAGYNKDGIVEKINASLKKKFNEEGKWKVETKLQNPEDILAYGFLKKNIDFEYAFQDLKDGLDFVGTKVKAFGLGDIKEEENRNRLAKQVKLLFYDSDDNFIISLKGKNTNDEVILAHIEPKDTLSNTLNYALSNSGKEEVVTSNDFLQIPMFQFDINKNFNELINKSLENKGFEDYSIGSAIQRIQFSLTERGAELKSKAEIGMLKSVATPKKPKKLVFDKPFLLYMKQKDKDKPYFVMWVENPEVMIQK